MKIVSPFKDFYDFNTFGVPDNTNVYVRRTENLYIKPSVYKQSELFKFVSKYCYVHYSLYLSKSDYELSSYVLGIYPNLYLLNIASPLLGITDERPAFVLPDDILHDVVLINRLIDPVNNVKHISSTPFTKKHNHLYYRNHGFDCVEYNGKPCEKSEVFKELNCPVFFGVIKGSTKEIDGEWTSDVIVKNPNLCKLNSMFNGLIEHLRQTDPDLDNTIYDRIENFLYSSKVMPMTEPDNETKIINAGFDLKTSFRNIK